MLWACSQLRAWWFLSTSLWLSMVWCNHHQPRIFPQGNRRCMLTCNHTSCFQDPPCVRLLLPLSFPYFLTSSHTVYLMKRHPCQAAEFQLNSNMQFLCIPGPHCKQPTYSPSWYTNLCPQTGMLLLFQSATKRSEQVTVPLDGTAVLCGCGSTDMSLHFHTYWDLPTRLHVSHQDMAKIWGNKVAAECIRLTNVLSALLPQLEGRFGCPLSAVQAVWLAAASPAPTLLLLHLLPLLPISQGKKHGLTLHLKLNTT